MIQLPGGWPASSLRESLAMPFSSDSHVPSGNSVHGPGGPFFCTFRTRSQSGCQWGLLPEASCRSSTTVTTPMSAQHTMKHSRLPRLNSCGCIEESGWFVSCRSPLRWPLRPMRSTNTRESVPAPRAVLVDTSTSYRGVRCICS